MRTEAGELLQKIARIVAIELNSSPDAVLAAASLRLDLGMDSIAAANILFAIEEEFEISFEGVPVRRIDRLEEVADLVERVCGEKS